MKHQKIHFGINQNTKTLQRNAHSIKKKLTATPQHKIYMVFGNVILKTTGNKQMTLLITQIF